MSEFKGTFEFFCRPTKTADNKKTIVELTAGYNHDQFCEVEKFWDQKIILHLVKEEFKNSSKKSKSYNFLIFDNKHNKGSKDVKTFTIFMSKLFDLDELLELCEFLHQKVYVTWSKIQPDIDFEKEDNEIPIDEPEDPEDSDDDDD